MANKKPGNLTQEADGFKVVFERHFAHDVLTVWDVITNPAKMALWFFEVDLELKPGARMVIHYNDEQNTEGYGRITAVEPGKLFEYLWENPDGPDEISRWELFPEGPATCRLVLTHSRIDLSYATNVPMGWHIMLDRVETILAGRTEPFPSTRPGESDYDKALKKMYEEIFQQLQNQVQ